MEGRERLMEGRPDAHKGYPQACKCCLHKHANATCMTMRWSLNNSLHEALSREMPRFVINEEELSSIRTESDALFDQKRLDLANHHDRTRQDWHLVFIRANQESVSCRGMDVSMALHQIESLQRHFNNGTISRYQMMCAGLRTVIATPEDPRGTPATVYRAPCARCNICNRRGIPYAVCLSCGEDSGGHYLWIFHCCSTKIINICGPAWIHSLQLLFDKK